MRPILSIIIPTYNFLESLDDTIHSVTDQLTSDCELIIIDDGSDGEFVRELKKHEGKYPDCRIVYCPHGGVSAARNKGLSMAEGKYVSFLDGDDYMFPGFIDGILALIKNDADLYVMGLEYINIPENIQEVWSIPNKVYETVSGFADDYVRTMHPLLYSPCNKLYRNELIQKHGIRFDENVSFGEDRLFNFEYMSHSKAIITSELIMFKYLCRGRQSASTKHIPYFFDISMKLHEAKMDCILSLSRGTSEKEKRDFEMRDLAREIKIAVERFSVFPEEKEQCIERINDIVFVKGCPVDEVTKEILLSFQK